MANVSDPLANSLSGSDPQNLMEYITRQKIYDSRFWKEECFGLTVADVLEKAAKQLQCIGGLPTKFLSLALKLLQLHPETDLVVESFIQQDEFKYVRALGCFYVRLTARPVEVYEALEPLYSDRRKLRVWTTATQEWSIQHLDEFIHDLLQHSSLGSGSGGGGGDSRALGMALPRLPGRAVLQEAGYLPDGPRATALADVLADHDNDPLQYFRYKVQVEKSPAAIAAWKRRCERLGIKDPLEEEKPKKRRRTLDQEEEEEEGALPQPRDEEGNEQASKKKKKKKERNYGSLFKQDKNAKKKQSAAPTPDGVQEHSDEYWNEERARLGLKPLRK